MYNVENAVFITIPSMHAAMISYQYSRHVSPLWSPPFDFAYYHASGLSYRENTTYHLLWSDGARGPRDDTFIVKEPADLIRLWFCFTQLFHPDIGRLGFRFFFSFHNRTALPSRLQDGRWNCSVPHWADFQAHFPCDLEADCVRGEDEQDCPYTDVSRCGAGAISLGESCYFYVISKNDVSWNDAMDTCEKLHAHLVNLNTPTEWNDVIQVLLVREAAIYLGLRSASPHLPY